jgi:LacI family transcriptional regulator
VTQADIARKAGVHTTTVSLALRGHPSIPIATRQRIESLAESMGYKPDPALRALMAYRSRISTRRATTILAYVTNWSTRWGWKNSPAHAEFFAGASAKADELGFALEHFWLREPGVSHQRLNDILIARGIRGLVLASHLDDQEQTVELDWKQFSAVKIDVLPQSLGLHHVTNHQCAIVQLAVRRTLAAGYRKIGFVIPRWWDEIVDLAWSAGFLAEQARLPLADRVPMLVYARADESGGPRTADSQVPAELLAQWLHQHEPEVVLSYAPFVVGRLQELGRRIPTDISYVDVFVKSCDGSIAGIRQNCHRVGEVALETLGGLLAQNITGLPVVPSATLIEGTWVDGASLPCRSELADTGSPRDHVPVRST